MKSWLAFEVHPSQYGSLLHELCVFVGLFFTTYLVTVHCYNAAKFGVNFHWLILQAGYS